MRLRCGFLLDAQWVWAAYGFGAGFNYQAPGVEGIQAIAVDTADNTYLTGTTTGTTFPVTAGAFQTQPGGGICSGGPGFSVPPVACSDAFAVKLDPTGAVVWATLLGGSGSDSGSAIAVDAAGNVYVAGTTGIGGVESPALTTDNFPTTSGSAFPTMTTSSGGFVVKLNPTGSQMIYGTYIPGTAEIAMTIDSNGSAYVTGYAQPATFNFPTTAGAFQNSSIAGVTGLVVKLNPAGSALVYATYLGGTAAQGVTQPSGVAVDSSGNAYVTGTATADFPVTQGAFQTVCASACATARTAFVTKLNAAGSGLVYSTFLGGSGGGSGNAIKVDSQGRAYILGNSASFATTPGAFEPAGAAPPPWNTSPEGQFLASLSVDGTALVYGTFISGAEVLEVDAAGDAYVAGSAVSGFPVSAGAFEQCYNGNSFAAEFSPAGALVGATYFGPSSTELVNALAVGQNGLVTIAATAPESQVVANFLIDNPQLSDSPCVSPMVQNAANYYNYGTAIAPGELVTLQGVGIGPETGVSGTPVGSGASERLPTQLAGVQVFFNNIAAPLQYVQSGQINAAVPWELAGQTTAQVQVVYNSVPLNSFSLQVQQAMPGLFFLSYPSSQAAILNADGSINSASNPAHAGDEIALFGTGAGPTSPAGVTGGYWGLNSNTLLTIPVTIQIGGVNAPVVYAGAAPGLLSTYFQINVQVPQGLGANPAAHINIMLGPIGPTSGGATLYGGTVGYLATVAVQ